MKKIIILGCTGSIGQSALTLVRSRPEDFTIVGLSAHTSIEKLKNLGQEFPDAILALTGSVVHNQKIKYLGSEGINKMIQDVDADIVINAITGASGLIPSFTTLKSGKDLALANKETMVMAGELITALAKQTGKKVLPVDSEHAALFELLNGRNIDDVEELILTASGGAFRDFSLEQLAGATLKQALTHPNWSMGPKITIDSATMANKGLEVLEAWNLYHFPIHRIKVLIHPQSLVHALIRTKDLALYAQMSQPDMKLPIQNALDYPEYQPLTSAFLNLAGQTLTFSDPDPIKYPLLPMAYQAGQHGGCYPAVFNAANEEAVDAFIAEKISFITISQIVGQTLEHEWSTNSSDLGTILEADTLARGHARSFIRSLL